MSFAFADSPHFNLYRATVILDLDIS